jgi:hypothetical protein
MHFWAWTWTFPSRAVSAHDPRSEAACVCFLWVVTARRDVSTERVPAGDSRLGGSSHYETRLPPKASGFLFFSLTRMSFPDRHLTR